MTTPNLLHPIPILHHGDLFKFWVDIECKTLHRVELFPEGNIGRPHIERLQDLDPALVDKFNNKLNAIPPCPSI